ncbi:MAG: hypothetical protein ACR2MY_04885 [Candidatus Dormibacteria bacterium]
MAELTLAGKVIAVHRALRAEGVAHAFGGALALAYYAEPRATADIDLNVFLPPDQHQLVAGVLTPLGVLAEISDALVVRDGQARVWWGRTPLDLFYAYDPLHDAMRAAARPVPFGEDTIKILSPEHLVVCKALFARPKDWLDIEQVLALVPDLRLGELSRWMTELVGGDDPRSQRLAALLPASAPHPEGGIG